VISLAIIAYLVSIYRSGIGWIDLVTLLFFGALPDLVSFIPIGLTSSNNSEGAWPSWGASLYNLFHTILIWTLVFAIAWILLRAPYLPLFAWLLHITIDRWVGYTLRSKR
jgi:hypothetical protein